MAPPLALRNVAHESSRHAVLASDRLDGFTRGHACSDVEDGALGQLVEGMRLAAAGELGMADERVLGSAQATRPRCVSSRFKSPTEVCGHGRGTIMGFAPTGISCSILWSSLGGVTWWMEGHNR